MEIERRSQLKIVGRRNGHSMPSSMPGIPVHDRCNDWNVEILSEISRVHALLDMVNCELDRMQSDESMHAIKVIEKNAEVRELQAYYKGLRFALDRHKENMSRRLLVTIKLD